MTSFYEKFYDLGVFLYAGLIPSDTYIHVYYSDFGLKQCRLSLNKTIYSTSVTNQEPEQFIEFTWLDLQSYIDDFDLVLKNGKVHIIKENSHQVLPLYKWLELQTERLIDTLLKI